jgi:hypothetical protein
MQLTIKQFIDQFEGCDPNDILDFSPLTFCRLKRRGEHLIHVEFNEAVMKTGDTEIIFQKISP